MRVVRNILAASGVIGSLFASAGVKEVLLPGGQVSLMMGFGWWGGAKLWHNVRHEAVAQLQDQPVLPSD